MKFAILKNNFAKGLNSVNRLVAGHVPLPILSNILIKTKPGELSLAVTDLELGIETTVAAKTEGEAAFTVPARLLTEFVQLLSASQLEGEVVNNSVLELKADNTEAKIRGLDASEYPNLPFTSSKAQLAVGPAELKAAIEGVSFACAIDETRPTLSGVFLRKEEGELVLVATDSYRLAESRIKTKSKGNFEAIIVPKKTLAELCKLLADETVDISVFVGENQIQLGLSSSRIVSRLIEGNYPNYQAIIPNSFRTRATVNVGELLTTLKAASLFAREAGNLVKFELAPGAGLTIKSVAETRGESSGQVTAIVEGEGLTIAFNAKYLLDALGAIGADNVFLELDGKERPLVIRPANNPNYLSLVMPLKID